MFFQFLTVIITLKISKNLDVTDDRTQEIVYFISKKDPKNRISCRRSKEDESPSRKRESWSSNSSNFSKEQNAKSKKVLAKSCYSLSIYIVLALG